MQCPQCGNNDVENLEFDAEGRSSWLCTACPCWFIIQPAQEAEAIMKEYSYEGNEEEESG